MTELFPAEPANPTLSADALRPALARAWGIEGELRPLGSLQDQNYRVRTGDGTLAVAKIAGRHTPPASIALQDAAMRHLATRPITFAAPAPIPTRTGADGVEVDGHHVRLLTWVEGSPLADRAYLGPADLVAHGELIATVTRAFEGFEHAGLDDPNGWDLRLAAATLAECRPHLPADWSGYLDDGIAAFERVGAGAPLPRAVIHGDLSPVNAVCLPTDELRSTPTGILDFGDVMRTWRIGDLVAAVVGAAEHPGTGDTLDAALAILAGYQHVLPLTEAELDAFWPLVIARAAVTAAVSMHQYLRNPGNEYAEQAVTSGLRSVRRVAEVPPALATAAARLRVGSAAVPGPDRLAALRALPPVEVVTGLADAPIADRSVDSDDFAYGEWSGPAGPVTVARWGEARMDDRPRTSAPDTLQLGVEVTAAPGAPVRAPVSGPVTRTGTGALIAAADGVQLRLTGVVTEADHAVAGELLGTAATGTVGVQLLLAPDLPRAGLAAHRDAWAALCPDPSFLLGRDLAAVARDAAHLRAEREAVVARPQHLYYDRPLEIVRGWRHHLYDADGRCYVDMINNIAAIGHSHPRVVEAATRQLRRLNTNSRFLYDSMTRYAERMAALLPPELDRVFLVNSGSEAADLALQLAQRYTHRRDVVALAGAYHGWTGSVIDISTSPVDRPNWRNELPDWVHVAEQPDTYRGPYGDDAEAYRASVRSACASAPHGPAAFISEPLLGNQGALELPAGYLKGVYEDVRAAGGLCIADEVQVGMARTGVSFWAFEHEGVVPDIVYTAKATGNGHPLGVVVCRREIADTFDGQTSYFSSTGGGPVSCEIGLAVLDVLRDEGLQDNARVIGDHLKARLTELAERHPLIGAVHGRGLYQGVDLVLDRETRTPARFEALAVSERLRARGVIMQPTGDAFNVLKVKPPMCLDRAAADHFVDALDTVLTEFV